MHGGEVLQRPGRQRAVELVQRPRRRQRLRALDLRALELAPQQLLEAPDLVAGERRRRRGVGLARRAAGLRAQPERAADALDVDAEHAGALAAAAERGDREPGEVAHRGLVAVADRLPHQLAQRRRSRSARRRCPVLASAPLRPAPSRDAALASRPPRRRGRRSARTRGRRCAGPRATWRASPRAPRGSPPGSVQPTSLSAANASSSSEVPTAMPSRRSSSPELRRAARRPEARRRQWRRAHADALGHDVEVGAVLDDDRHRRAEDLGVDVVGAEQQQRARPVDRLGDRRRLLEVELAHHRTTSTSRRATARRSSGACSRTISSSCSASGSRATGTGSGA